MPHKKRFAIGLSFPGRHRRTVRTVAHQLEADLPGQEIFFDETYQHELLGPDADNEFRRIYRDECELVVPFFSTHYETKWCKLEWSAIRSILFERRKERSVIPVHLDATKIPGWESTDLGIIKGKKTSKEIAIQLSKIYRSRIAKQAGAESKQASVKGSPGTTTGRTCAAPFTEIDQPEWENRAGEPERKFGFVVVADISDSSSLPGRRLKDVISRLWKTPKPLSPKRTGASSSGILDGIILAFPVSTRNLTHEVVLESCRTWVHQMAAQANVSIRIAVLYGEYDVIDDPPLIVGRIPNEGNWLVRIAGPGQLIISERFVQSWRGDVGDQAIHGLLPAVGEKPWEIEQEPGATSLVRLYTDDLSGDPPRLLQSISQAEQGIEKILEQIDLDFADLVNDLDESLTPRKLGVRVSAFVPDRAGQYLIATDFRRLRYAEAARSDQTKPGLTRYFIGDKNVARGTLGCAFKTGRVQVIHDLPSFRGQSEAYIDRLGQSPWQMPEKMVRQLGRKARTYMAIPFALTRARPEGVVCIDTKNPLTNVPLNELRAIGELLELQYGIALAALWRLRR